MRLEQESAKHLAKLKRKKKTAEEDITSLLNENIEYLKSRDNLYKSIQDFRVSYNKTTEVIVKMKEINRKVESNLRKIATRKTTVENCIEDINRL
jgi:hypothetical protein